MVKLLELLPERENERENDISAAPVETGNSPSSTTKILQIPLRIRTVYGIYTVLFSEGTTAPATSNKVFFTCEEYDSGDYEVLMVQGFNLTCLFNMIVGQMSVHLEEPMPKYSKLELVFGLLVDGIQVYLTKNDGTSSLVFRLIDTDLIFPGTEEVNGWSRLHSLGAEFERKFLSLILKKQELMEYVRLMTERLQTVTHENRRQEMLDWIMISNDWLEVGGEDQEFGGEDQEFEELVARVSSAVLEFLRPQFDYDSEFENFEEEEHDSDSDSDSELDNVEEEEHDSDSDSDSEFDNFEEEEHDSGTDSDSGDSVLTQI